MFYDSNFKQEKNNDTPKRDAAAIVSVAELHKSVSQGLQDCSLLKSVEFCAIKSQ